MNIWLWRVKPREDINLYLEWYIYFMVEGKNSHDIYFNLEIETGLIKQYYFPSSY